MKLVAIGDIHGRNTWKAVVKANPDADKVVFIGDYFDSRTGEPMGVQLENFFEILQYKRENMNKVVLLIGNHDYHYFRGVKERYSGWQPEASAVFELALYQARIEKLMVWVHREDGYLFSHAGVTNSWLGNTPCESVEEINELPDRAFSFNAGLPDNAYHSYIGDNITQTPIWVRPESLLLDRFEHWGTQVVGHTMQDGVLIHEKGVIFIDCVGWGKYLIIQDGKPKEASI